MKIRSITIFAGLDQLTSRTAAFADAAREAFHVPVQSIGIRRRSPSRHGGKHLILRLYRPRRSRRGARKLGPTTFRWDAFNCDTTRAGWTLFQRLSPAVIGCLLVVRSPIWRGTLTSCRCQAMAEIIRRVSVLQPDGFKNLYMAALANCPHGSPFFPVAYHDGGEAHFALAVQWLIYFWTPLGQPEVLQRPGVILFNPLRPKPEIWQKLPKISHPDLVSLLAE